MSEEFLDKNPFPQLGNPNTASVTIDPIGYDYEINHIINIIDKNIGHQPLLFPIIGLWGQGKSTILRFFKEKVLTNIYKLEFQIDTIDNFKNKIINSYKEYKNQKSSQRGLMILLDEGQNLVDEIKEIHEKQKKTGKKNEKFKNFLIDLRTFIDGKIEEIDSSEICLLFGMHPEVFENIKYYATDIIQRIHTNLLKLEDMNYYQAYEILTRILKKKNLKIENVFSISVIYSIYALLPSMTKKIHGIERYNGRIFAQIFFELYNFWLKSKKKISLKDLKDILLGKIRINIGENQLKLPDVDAYFNLKNSSIYEEESLDYYIFNPNWHFEEDLNPRLLKFHEDNKEALFNQREGYIFKEKEYKNEIESLETELVNSLNKLDKENIFKNGEHNILLFSEKFLINEDLYEKFLKKHEKKKISVFRLNDIYLKKIFGYVPGLESPYTSILRSYFHKSPKDKIEQIRNIIRSLDIISDFELKDVETEKDKIPYIEIQYEFFKGRINHIPLFYYPKDWDIELEEFIYIIKNKLQNQEKIDFIIIIYDPYVPKKDIEKIDLSEYIANFRKLNNRIFLNSFDRNTLGEFLKNENSSIIENIIEDSKSSYFKESLEKGYLIPFTGIKLGSSNKLPRENFFKDIRESIKYQIDKKLKPVLFQEDEYNFFSINGEKIYDKNKNYKETKYLYMKSFPEKFIKSTLNEFFNFKELNVSQIKDLVINGSKISKYEQNILKIIENEKSLSLNQFKSLINKYYNINSRVDPYEFLLKVLQVRNIIEKKKKKIKLLNTEDLVNQIDDFIEKHSDIVIFMDEEEKNNYENLKKRFIDFKNKYNNEFKIDDYNVISINNTYLLNLLEKLNNLIKGSEDPFEIVNIIIKYRKNIENLLNSSIIEDPEIIRLNEVNILLEHIKEINSNIRNFLNDISEKNEKNELEAILKKLNFEANERFLKYFFIYILESNKSMLNYEKSNNDFHKIIEISSKIYQEFLSNIYKLEENQEKENLPIGEYFKSNPRTLHQIKDIIENLNKDLEKIFNNLKKIKILNSNGKKTENIFAEGITTLKEYNDYALFFQFINDNLKINFFDNLFKDKNFYNISDVKVNYPEESYNYYKIYNFQKYENDFIFHLKNKTQKENINYLTKFYDLTNNLSERYISIIKEDLIKRKLNKFIENDYPFPNANKIKLNNLGKYFFDDLKRFAYNLYSFKNQFKDEYFFFSYILYRYIVYNSKYKSQNENDINETLSKLDLNIKFKDLYQKGFFKKIKSIQKFYDIEENNENIKEKEFIEPRFSVINYIPKDFSKTELNKLLNGVISFENFKNKKLEELAKVETFDKSNLKDTIKNLIENSKFKEIIKEYIYSKNYDKKLANELELNKNKIIEIISFLKNNINLLDDELNKLYYLKNEIQNF
jgi:hypothetical protein